MEQKLYFIRHGHTDGITRGLMYGATDIPISELGAKEIAALADEGIYPDPEGAALYTSGMLRAEQSFEIIYGSRKHRIAPLLSEMNMGIYEMKTHEEIAEDDYGRAWLNGELEDPDLEGGERYSKFISRVNKGAREIIDECADEGIERIIIVFHGIAMTYIMENFFPGQQEDVWQWCPATGFGYEISVVDGVPVDYEPLG